MYELTIGQRIFKYLVGATVVAIISPTHKVYTVSLDTIGTAPTTRIHNGTADSRISPEEMASYIVSARLK